MRAAAGPAPEGLLRRGFARWNARLPTVGLLALASFAVAVVSGVLLAIPFDVRAAADAVQLLEVASPGARLVRGVHAWSSHLLVALTLLHALEHLLLRTERKLRRGVWLRAVIALPGVLLLALGGFLLKADAEGLLARQILAGLLERLPLFGAALSTSLLGPEGDLQLVYVHHVGTATVFVGLVIVEHARRLWPSLPALLGLTLAAALLALALPPGLHDGVDPVIKGPWYFVGLQEALHWLSRPGWLWLFVLAPLLLLAALRELPEPWRCRAGWALVALLALYALLSVWALGFRGEGWRVRWPWAAPASPSSRAPRALLAPLVPARADERAVPQVLGRREGCLLCHDQVTGFAPAHGAAALGCSSCHLGNPFSADAQRAHDGLVRVPGNLDSAALTCGQPQCHGAIVSRVQGSLMATGRGMVAVNRFVFGEQRTPDGATPIAALGDSPADQHLKELCVECHLGLLKREPAPIAQSSRGGGCTACHLRYAPRASRYSAKNARAFAHPSLSVQISDESCFGCHSRSGRIALSYPGWSETLRARGFAGVTGQTRVLDDGRQLQRQHADVHHDRGMACIDCHTSREAMGDGQRYLHQDQAIELECADCHPRGQPRTLGWGELDAESRAILVLRHGRRLDARFVVARRSGRPLINVTLAADNTLRVAGKLNRRLYRPRRQAAACASPGISGHERLSCGSCHTRWAHHCVSCHTQHAPGGEARDARNGRKLPGEYVEYAAEPRIDPPTLGVRGHGARTAIATFAPGMILTVNPPRPGQLPARELPGAPDALIDGRSLFARLYAPAAPHTTQQGSRSCASCHADPLALGLGRGRLSLVPVDGVLAWRFAPELAPLARDGLPADAWTDLLVERRGISATRTDARPFDRVEQQRILRVGACLGCHDPAHSRQRLIYRDFPHSVRQAPAPCRVPGRAPPGAR